MRSWLLLKSATSLRIAGPSPPVNRSSTRWSPAAPRTRQPAPVQWRPAGCPIPHSPQSRVPLQPIPRSLGTPVGSSPWTSPRILVAPRRRPVEIGQDGSVTLRYCNPVYPGYFADPFVLHTGGAEPAYVAVGTGRVVNGHVFEVLV